MHSLTRGAYAVAMAASAALLSPGAVAQAHPEVLPDTVVPVNYDLTLVPDAQALSFSGRVVITVEVAVPVRDIVLNATGLDFDRIAIDDDSTVTATMDAQLERSTLHSAKEMAPGRHRLSIDYRGLIGRGTLGFFAMDYAGPDGPQRTLATNFEPAAARQLLPCWDEPGRKATFNLTVNTLKTQMAVSNMPVEAVTSISETVQRVRFAQTPKMSTYLLFLGIGDFERIHRAVDGVDVGVVVKRGDTGKAVYGLDQAVELLHYYNEYFGTPYPLPKLDLIAAPGAIDGGSMENWGAIFYSQEHILFDPQNSTEQDRQLVFLVVAHEMAHQWFGDLVTMAWWDNLWLNEGFARWMQTYAADDLHPEWKTGIRALSIFESGKQADAIPSTHPVVQTVITAEQAQQAFDRITYDKGAAIITMINGFVGRDVFREGVRNYMHQHAYGNTVDDDLWSLMQAVAGKPILDIEHDLTRQAGVPLVRVEARGAATRLTEARFADDPRTIAKLSKQVWRLPISARSLNQDQVASVVMAGPATFELAAPVLVNAGQTTYARILYSTTGMRALKEHMPTLSPQDQVGLLNDTAALGLAGYTSAGNVLGLIQALPADADPIVWQVALRILVNFDRRYVAGPAKAAFRQNILAALQPLMMRLGYSTPSDEDGNVQILRGALEDALGEFGDAAVLAWARQVRSGKGGSAADQRSALAVVAEQADAATFEALLAEAQGETDPLKKQHVYEALAELQDPGLALRMLDVAVGEGPPPGVASDLLLKLSANHPSLMCRPALAHLEDPKLAMDKGERWVVAAALATLADSPECETAMRNYMNANVPPSAQRPFAGALASIRNNQRISKEAMPEVSHWVATHPTTLDR